MERHEIGALGVKLNNHSFPTDITIIQAILKAQQRKMEEIFIKEIGRMEKPK